MISNSLTQRLFLLKQEVQEIQFINPDDENKKYKKYNL